MEPSNKKLKVCAYVRVSTRSESQKHSLDEQNDYWTKKLGNNTDYEFVKIYSDYGYSGKIDNRPAYRKMINDALSGKIDLIFTKAVSRFGRNINTILGDINTLREHNVFVIFETENIDTHTDEKDFFMSIYSIIAEEQLAGTSKAIKFGFAQKFKSGSTICKPILGYKVEKNGDDYDFTIIPEQAETVRLIFDLYNLGKTFTEISAYLTEHNYLNKQGSTIWHAPMIPYILSNEKYIGAVYMQKYFNSKFKTFKNNIDRPITTMYAIENHHEPIISKEVFEKAKEKLSSRVQRVYDKRRNNKDILSDFIVCGKCGNHYKRIIRKNKDGEEKVTYRCGKNRYISECCHNPTLYLDKFEILFVDVYNKYMSINKIDDESNLLNKEIEDKLKIIDKAQLECFKKIISNEEFERIAIPLRIEHKELVFKLHTHLNHILNGKKIPNKIFKFREDLLKFVLVNAVVNENNVVFHFNNSIIIEAEMEKPRKGNHKKSL